MKVHLEGLSPEQLSVLCGPGDQVLARIEKHFDVRLHGKPGEWVVQGAQAENAVQALYALAEIAAAGVLEQADIEAALSLHAAGQRAAGGIRGGDVLKAARRNISGKTPNQKRYVHTMLEKELTIAVGPAGSGKTYLAVAAAVHALTSQQIERIILTRPAVEAGEKLGFLPGDLQQKVDPYLRPLFDALADMLGMDKMNALMEAGRIEVAPLAYMRGRTLNDAFVILDEAQNTSRAQMKMFLTRLGFASRMVVTGDITQMDIPNPRMSGLLHALKVLEPLEEIGICRLTGKDVVRHRLVERIVAAYDADDQ